MDCALRIETDQPSLREHARVLAARLGLPIAGERGTDAPGLILAQRDEGLELRDPSMRGGRGLRIDFTQLARRGRRGSNLSRRTPLARAMGRDSRRVIDATAGLGQDAAMLAAIGFDVLAIERHPILAAMLDEGLARALACEPTAALLGGRLRFQHADALQALPRMARDFDAVYLDPMFPPKRRASALAKKELRLLRELVGDDPHAADLLECARRHAPRVIVKRPDDAPPLAPRPTSSAPGKLVRYDVYVTSARS